MPQDPCRHRAPRPPRLGEREHLGRRRAGARGRAARPAPGPARCRGPATRPAGEHHQPVDRRRPRPDPGQRGQRRVDAVVVERREAVDVQRAVLDRGRQRPRVARLLAAEPDRQELARRRGAGTSPGSADRPPRGAGRRRPAPRRARPAARGSGGRGSGSRARAPTAAAARSARRRRRAPGRPRRARIRRPAAASVEGRRDGGHAASTRRGRPAGCTSVTCHRGGGTMSPACAAAVVVALVALGVSSPAASGCSGRANGR